jgi:carbon monoxide dehydrogenase subunit G
MEMNGSQRIAASREQVYAGLNNIEVLRQCIPGCEEIVKRSDTEMTARVTLKIGPVKASFNGTVLLSDLDPPHGYTISGEGSGGAAGFAKGGAAVKLLEDGDGTILNYVVRAQIGGKLAQIGSRLIDATSKKLADEFFVKFGQVVAPAPIVEENRSEDEEKGWLRKVFGGGHNKDSLQES